MRKLIMWNLITLDGFFEGPKSWDLDWHGTVWGDELEQISIEQSRSIGALVFGRITYEGMASYWTTATGEVAVAEFMNRVPKIVFSRTLKKVEWNNSLLVKDDAVTKINELKKQTGQDLYIFGSADLSSTFIGHGLIDEYRLAVVPIVLGQGNPLFKANPERMKLQLVEARPLKSGCVILRYQKG